MRENKNNPELKIRSTERDCWMTYGLLTGMLDCLWYS